VRAIDAAKAVALILSQSSAASPHVLREVERASSKRHPVIAFRVDQAPLSTGLEYFLNTSQWLDASAEPASALPTLVTAVRRVIASAPGGVASPLRTSAESPPPFGPAQHATRRRRTLVAIVASSLAALALVSFTANRLWLFRRVATVQPATDSAAVVDDRSIAVLSFADMSENKDQGYFADGMAEEMVDILARIPQLKVIGRASSFQFKGQTEDLQAIGEKLGATYIVQGSVRKSGQRIRVTAQLFDSRSGAQLWAESYDREFGDVLALQDQIASNIARALQLAVATDETQLLRRLKSPEAYTLYLHGRSAYDRGALREAQANFEQVLALEPKFSRAAEALALTRLGMLGSGSGTVENGVGWQHAVNASNLALRLDPRSALAHAILGLKLATYDYDRAGAIAEFQAAVAAQSRDPIALYNCSWLAFDLGRYDEAMRLQEASLSLDPLNPDALQNGAIIQYLLGQFDDAERDFRRSLAVSPTLSGSHRYLGQMLLLRGQPGDALKEMEVEQPDNRDFGLALAYHALGRKAESDAALSRVRDAGSDLNATSIAIVHAYRGEIDQAFEWLDRSIAVRNLDLGHKLEKEPLLASLRADPRYLELLRKMRLRD
jgi:TolB-like protein